MLQRITTALTAKILLGRWRDDIGQKSPHGAGLIGSFCATQDTVKHQSLHAEELARERVVYSAPKSSLFPWY